MRTPHSTRRLACWRSASSRSSRRAVPLKGLPGHGRDALEVPVTMQQGQTLEFGRRRHDEIYGSGAAVLPSLGQCFLDLPRAIESAVVHRHPPKQQPHVLDALSSVRGGAGAVEKLQLGDRAGRDEPGCCRLIPAVLLGIDALMDMARTSVNVLGNCLATAVVARWEGVRLDGKATG